MDKPTPGEPSLEPTSSTAPVLLIAALAVGVLVNLLTAFKVIDRRY